MSLKDRVLPLIFPQFVVRIVTNHFIGKTKMLTQTKTAFLKC